MANFALFGRGSNNFSQICISDIGSFSEPQPICGDILSDTPEYHHPNPIEYPDTIASVHAGNNHTLIHTTKGRVFGIGWNDYGQTGVGTWHENPKNNKNSEETTIKTFKEAIIYGHTIKRVYSRQNFTIFITHDDRTWVCGWNNHSCLGVNNSSDRVFPVTLITGNHFASKKVVHVASGGCYVFFWTTEGKMYASGYPAGVDSIKGFNFGTPTEWTPMKDQLFHKERYIDAVCLSNHITLLTNHGRAWLYDKTTVTQVRANFITQVWEAHKGCLYRESSGKLYRFTKESGVNHIDVPHQVTWMFDGMYTECLYTDGQRCYKYNYSTKDSVKVNLPYYGHRYELQVSESGAHGLFLFKKKVDIMLQTKMWSAVERVLLCDIDVVIL